MKTLREIEECPKDFLLASEISDYLRVDPQAIRDVAKYGTGTLGFPVIVAGTRVLIPKLPFVHFCKYGYAPIFVDGRREQFNE